MFTVNEVTSDADFEELIPLLWHSYSHPRIPFLPLLFPVEENDPDGQQKAVDESKKLLVQAHHADPTGHWFKATDSETGRIIGGCRWHVNKTNPYQQDTQLEKQVDAATEAPYEAPTYKKGVAQEFASLILGQILNPRAKRYVRPHTRTLPQLRGHSDNANIPHDLHICFVDPEYRGRGVGRMLMQWGVDKADQMQVESFLEATDMGKRLYEKFGFVVVTTESADAASHESPSEEWKQMQEKFLPFTWHCMWRPVGGKFIEGKTKLPW